MPAFSGVLNNFPKTNLQITITKIETGDSPRSAGCFIHC